MNKNAGGRRSYSCGSGPRLFAGKFSLVVGWATVGDSRRNTGYSSSKDSNLADMMAVAGTVSWRLISRVSPQVAVST